MATLRAYRSGRDGQDHARQPCSPLGDNQRRRTLAVEGGGCSGSPTSFRLSPFRSLRWKTRRSRKPAQASKTVKHEVLGVRVARAKIALELKAATELQHTRGLRRGGAEAGDVAECSSSHRRVRVSENGVIQYIERLEANLELRLTIYGDERKTLALIYVTPGPRNWSRIVLPKTGETPHARIALLVCSAIALWR